MSITTQGSWWWIDQISVNDSSYSYYNNEVVDLEADSYTINESFFVVERRNKTTLFIQMDKNTSGEERIMNLVLEAGNYFDYVTVKQAAQ